MGGEATRPRSSAEVWNVAMREAPGTRCRRPNAGFRVDHFDYYRFPLSRGRVWCARRYPHGKTPETPSLRSVAPRDDPRRDAVPLLRPAPRLRTARRRETLGSSPSRILILAPSENRFCQPRCPAGVAVEDLAESVQRDRSRGRVGHSPYERRRKGNEESLPRTQAAPEAAVRQHGRGRPGAVRRSGWRRLRRHPDQRQPDPERHDRIEEAEFAHPGNRGTRGG